MNLRAGRLPVRPHPVGRSRSGSFPTPGTEPDYDSDPARRAATARSSRLRRFAVRQRRMFWGIALSSLNISARSAITSKMFPISCNIVTMKDGSAWQSESSRGGFYMVVRTDVGRGAIEFECFERTETACEGRCTPEFGRLLSCSCEAYRA